MKEHMQGMREHYEEHGDFLGDTSPADALLAAYGEVFMQLAEDCWALEDKSPNLALDTWLLTYIAVSVHRYSPTGYGDLPLSRVAALARLGYPKVKASLVRLLEWGLVQVGPGDCGRKTPMYRYSGFEGRDLA